MVFVSCILSVCLLCGGRIKIVNILYLAWVYVCLWFCPTKFYMGFCLSGVLSTRYCPTWIMSWIRSIISTRYYFSYTQLSQTWSGLNHCVFFSVGLSIRSFLNVLSVENRNWLLEWTNVILTLPSAYSNFTWAVIDGFRKRFTYYVFSIYLLTGNGKMLWCVYVLFID